MDIENKKFKCDLKKNNIQNIIFIKAKFNENLKLINFIIKI
jgi:hypothetical protein